jgi:hypothetical protein
MQRKDNSSGYIYCFSNVSMPGIYKIGMTERTPEKRLSDANNCDTWRPPTPYKIEFAKKVVQPKLQENILHKRFTELGGRINEKREFFCIPIEKIKEQFDQINGENWVPRLENVVETIAIEKSLLHKHQCTLCNKLYSNRSGLWKHKKACHLTTKTPQPCQPTDRPFAMTEDMFLYLVKQNAELIEIFKAGTSNDQEKQDKVIHNMSKNIVVDK